MEITTALGTFGPFQPWVDVQSSALAWHDRGRKEWVGHTIKLGDDYFVVDRVEEKRRHLAAASDPSRRIARWRP